MDRYADAPPAVKPVPAAESTRVPEEKPADPSRSNPPAPKFMKIKEYAARTGYSPRTIEYFMDEGLPTVGEHRLRRVDVEPADEWIRGRAARVQDERTAIEDDAREDARRRGTASARGRG
jgi:hypothetical protein